MPYRLRYFVNVDFVPPGVGLGQQSVQATGVPGSPGVPNAGQQQTFEIDNAVMPVSNTFVSGDVTALLASMSADLSTQLNANLARIQAFATGGG